MKLLATCEPFCLCRMCFRQELGRCDIRYAPSSETDPFFISDVTQGNQPAARNGQNCNNDYVIIPRSRHSSQGETEELCTAVYMGNTFSARTTDRFCSAFINCIRSAMVNTPAVIQEVKPGLWECVLGIGIKIETVRLLSFSSIRAPRSKSGWPPTKLTGRTTS